MKNITILLLIATIFFNLVSCDSKSKEILGDDDMNFVEKSDISEDDNMSLAEQSYIFVLSQNPSFDDKIEEFINTHPSMDELANQISILKYKSINGLKYTILNINGSFHYITFDNNNKVQFNRIISFSNNESEEEIKKIVPGDSLSSVREIDPLGQYDFLYAGSSKFPQYSYHFFENGNAYYISYSNEKVVNVTFFTI